MSNGRVEGKVATVTGGAQGIGAATGTRLAEEGADVVIFDIPDKGADVAAEIEATGARSVFMNVDLTKEAAVQKAIAQVVDTFGTIDILVNNAATKCPKPNGTRYSMLTKRARSLQPNIHYPR
tara:strand:- start:126 stop:494 length:369 start_codon:yes stop_codon:yes gene_type:complete